MNQYLEKAKALRQRTDMHFNCAQTLTVAFADPCGISQKKAFQMGQHFGSGMKMAGTCGAITGALMVIGMLGGGDEEYRAFMKLMKDHHEGMTDCKDLLKKNAEQGGEKKAHCDAMIYEAIEAVSQVMGLN